MFKRLGTGHNLISEYRRQGFSQQKAYDVADDLMKTRYRDWFHTLAEVPLLHESIDAQVQQYIEGCANMVVANLHWR